METYDRAYWKRMERSALYKVLVRLHMTGATSCKHDSGRMRTV